MGGGRHTHPPSTHTHTLSHILFLVTYLAVADCTQQHRHCIPVSPESDREAAVRWQPTDDMMPLPQDVPLPPDVVPLEPPQYVHAQQYANGHAVVPSAATYAPPEPRILPQQQQPYESFAKPIKPVKPARLTAAVAAEQDPSKPRESTPTACLACVSPVSLQDTAWGSVPRSHSARCPMARADRRKRTIKEKIMGNGKRLWPGQTLSGRGNGRRHLRFTPSLQHSPPCLAACHKSHALSPPLLLV